MKIKHFVAVSALFALGIFQASAQSYSSYANKWHWDKGTIVVDTPVRPAGQQHVLGLTDKKIETVRVGFVGLGMRGPWAVMRFVNIPGVEVVALCDYEEGRAEGCQKFMREKGLAPAKVYYGEKGYEEMCKDPNIDLVYVATDWDHHYPVAKCALENGKHTAISISHCHNGYC